MNEVDRWFERTAGRHNRAVSLYACLLTGRLSAYFRYRLRFPFLVSTFRFAVHVAEFFILLTALGGVATFTVMVLRAGSLVVAGGWWGLLEIMRDRLRAYARSGERDAAELEIGRWLTLGATVAVVVATAGGIALLGSRLSGDDPVGRFYAFLVIVELALGLPLRVLHSGIYATRRVYKPIWSMFIPMFVQLAVLGSGFFFYPTAAVIIAIVASNAISIWISVRYCLEAYRMTGIRPRFTHRGFCARFPRIPLRLGLETTISGLSLRLDAVMVLALIGFYGTNARTFDLTAASSAWSHIDAFQFFYLILPLFRGTYESASIFYFDFVRLHRAPAIRPLQLRFFHQLLWVAPLIALFYWVLAAILDAVVLRNVPVSFLLALMPLFVVRSVIGVYQIRLFAEGRFAAHIGTLILLAGLLWLVWIKPSPASDLIEITAAMVVQLVVLINIQHWHDRRDPHLPTLLTFGEWTQSMRAEPGEVVTGTAVIPAATTTRQRSAAVRLLRETFDRTGYFAFRSPTTVVFYERGSTEDANRTHLALQTASGGTVGRIARQSIPDSAPHSPEALTAQFRELFDDGIAFDAETLRGSREMRSLDHSVLAQALQTSIANVEDGSDDVTLQGHRLSSVYCQGVLRFLFIVPADSDPQRLRQWRRLVKAGCTGDG